MSFRLHRGPKLLTLFHDTRSPTSQKILTMLQARVQPNNVKVGQDEVATSPASVYLKSAASAMRSSNAPFELEVVEKSRATPDQWNIIGSYLSKNKKSQVEELKDEGGALLVDWDDGRVLQSEIAVEKLLNAMGGNDNSNENKASWWSRGTS